MKKKQSRNSFDVTSLWNKDLKKTPNIIKQIEMTSNLSELFFARNEFVSKQPELAVPVLIIVAVAALAGTFGNLLIMLSILRRHELHTVESIFIVNLACSDMYVTAIANPLSITGKDLWNSSLCVGQRFGWVVEWRSGGKSCQRNGILTYANTQTENQK